jgi:dihydrofolate synthase / folylpolyglutamate synthase
MVPDPILDRLSKLHPKVMDLSLGRLERLLAALGNPEQGLPPVIHVAGTNGKGSTVAMLRSIQEAAGRRAHVYTSPHLVRFAERFVVASTQIDDAGLSAILEECEVANEGLGITLFEITTAAGMLAFSRVPADLLLLEVGLGGRLDATNVIGHPALSIITPVSLDHQHYLGDTIEAIAYEKAGILKPGVPTVIGRQSEVALDVIRQRAEEIGAPLAIQGRDWTVEPSGDGLVFRTDSMTRHAPRPALPGAHQIDNAGIVLAATEILQTTFPVSASALAEGMTQVRWPARLQKLTKGPMFEGLGEDTEIWVDGGHNGDAARVIADAVRAWTKTAPDRAIHLIFGTLNSRDPKEYLAAFKNIVGQVRAVTIPGETNSITAEDAAKAGHHVGLDAAASPSVAEAVRTITATSRNPKTILICGSLYLAGTVLRDHG